MIERLIAGLWERVEVWLRAKFGRDCANYHVFCSAFLFCRAVFGPDDFKDRLVVAAAAVVAMIASSWTTVCSFPDCQKT